MSGNIECPNCKKPLPNSSKGQKFCSVACFNLYNGKPSTAALEIRGDENFE